MNDRDCLAADTYAAAGVGDKTCYRVCLLLLMLASREGTHFFLSVISANREVM